MRRLRWEPGERKVPKRPYRDSAILYGVLASLVVVIAVATGGDLVRALVFAGAAFVLATGFSWWRWRGRLRRQEEEQ
jgi:Flp pilus assembly protein TadB